MSDLLNGMFLAFHVHPSVSRCTVIGFKVWLVLRLREFAHSPGPELTQPSTHHKELRKIQCSLKATHCASDFLRRETSSVSQANFQDR